MNFDAKNERHREALEYACRYRLGPRYETDALVREAAHALSSPEQSATIVLALGETLDMRVALTRLWDAHFVYFSDGKTKGVVERVHDQRLPTIILRLLAATDRDGALSALRGAP